MRFCGAHPLVSVFIVIAAIATVLGLSAAQASGAKHHQAPCAWGASSVSAEEVGGKDIVSPVATSGCLPK